MDPMLSGTRSWLERRYREAGIPEPGFRWVDRRDARVEVDGEASALLVEDRPLHQFLLILSLAGATGPEAVASLVRDDLDAAWALRAACLPSEGQGLPGGTSAWRVRIHWLGSAAQMGAWRAAVLHARQSGCLLDEIPVDGSFRGAAEALDPCLDRNGFPGLLLTTREVFGKDARGMDLWASADHRVRAAMANLASAFPEGPSRRIAMELQRLAQEEIPPAPPVGPARRIGSLAVQNVRGVRSLRLDPWPGGRSVQSWVVSGPNGSGKSSLAEAVSLKAFGASAGLCAYLRDPDVTKGKNPAGYLTQYVAPLGGGSPHCGFEGEPGPFTLATDLAFALETLAEAEGTLAPQGGPAAFLDTPGNDLGARMARSFSGLATRLSAHVETGRQQAAETRTALARRHGISPAVRLATTFQEKIAQGLLKSALTPLPPSLAAFLTCRATLPGGGAAGKVLETWKSAGNTDEFVHSLLQKGTPGRTALEDALRPVFLDQETRLKTLVDLLTAFSAQVAALPASLGLSAQASIWADWLERTPPAMPAPAPEDASPELARLLTERASVAEEGRRVRPHFDHLEASLAFLRSHWATHPQDCPTCGSHLAAPLEATVAGLLAAEQSRLAEQRERYAALTARIKELEYHPKEGVRSCPASPDTRRQIQSIVEALLGQEASAETLLRAPETRVPLVKLLAYAEAPPSPNLAAPEARSSAAACAETITSHWAEAASALAEPEAWDEVAKELNRRLADVVGKHLPATLEALWRELAACLSPAPWLLPAPPTFQPRTARGQNRVEVVLEAPDGKPRLARHLLNDAQRNTLGLAWTFCQHLVRARFQHAWMLLDDPAQDMDQPAFRALCRFLATLLSLYEAAGLPFTLILLLNQEDRAMDAARETGQGLILLGWTGRQEDAAVRRIALFGDGVRSPQPGDLFAKTGS